MLAREVEGVLRKTAPFGRCTRVDMLEMAESFAPGREILHVLVGHEQERAFGDGEHAEIAGRYCAPRNGERKPVVLERGRGVAVRIPRKLIEDNDE